MYVKAILLFLLVLLIGCASQHLKKTEQEKRTEELAAEIMEEKFKKNMVNILCDQPAYLVCFDIPREQCIEELSEYNIECFNMAKEKVSGSLTNEKNAEKFVTTAITCMMLDHIAVHAEKIEEIGKCFQGASLDETEAVRSLLK